MKKIFFILAGIFFLNVSSYAQNNRWLHMGEKNTVSIYIDTETIRYRSDDNSYMIYQKIFNQIKKTYTVQLCVYYCEDMEIYIIETNEFDEDENYLDFYEVNMRSRIIPESNWESVYNYLCKK